MGDRSTVRQGTLTIRDVNRYLDELNATEKTKDTYTKIFKELYTKCTPLEQKWLARIILKSESLMSHPPAALDLLRRPCSAPDMKMGTTEKTIFQEWHGSASDMWSVTSSLRSICDDLYDPEAVPQTQEVTLGSAFRPMLCERFKGEFNDIPKLMNNEPFWVEIKLDGERIQVHKDGENYKYFSRKGKDYTHLYGATVQEGCLTSYLDEVLLDQIDRSAAHFPY